MFERSIRLSFLFLFLYQSVQLYSQVPGINKRYIRIGSLQSHISAYGSERAWNNSYYEGLIWPADYSKQDNAVIKRAWIAAKDFTDADGQYWDVWGTYISRNYVGNSLHPVELNQTTKFELPSVFVDGRNISAPYAMDIDGDPDPDQIPDRIITNVVNTSLGLTMTRRILAFSQQYHDNYFIKEFIFKNTGNIDYDEEIELTDSLRGVRIGWGTRYSVSREGAMRVDNQQSWGKHSWITKRGEDYALHTDESITEANPIVDWIRCGFSWFGQSELVSYDNIGAPDISGGGRLTAPQHAGIAILHVDSNATNNNDDPYQPAVLGWHAGDSYPSVGNMTQSDMPGMTQLYNFLSGNPYPYVAMGGTDRMWENNTTSITDPVDPYTVHGDGGGTNLWICYGPFDLAHGDSIVIVEVEGINGLSRQMCETIGNRWMQAYQDPNDTGPFDLPDGTTTNDKNVFKNTWTYTGVDSILLTFTRAKRNYDSGYNIPQPPPPPATLEVISQDDRIILNWDSNAESFPSFAGYKIHRAEGRYDTLYAEIFSCGLGTNHPSVVNTYEDTDVVYDTDYYYYIVSFDDGSTNNIEPGVPLNSSRFWTRVDRAAFLRDYPAINADVYVSPDGNDDNSGLSPDSALRTITSAISRIVSSGLNPNSIYLSEGVYSPSSNGESYPLNWKSYVSLSGASQGSTILDAEDQGGIFSFMEDGDLLIENVTLKNGLADRGGAIYCRSSDLILMNVTIEGNTAIEWGGGIFCNSSTVGLTNVTIKENSASRSGGGICLGSDSNINFDSTYTCNLFNNIASVGSDISVSGFWLELNTDIVLDTFTVMHPTDYQAYPSHNFTFDIMNYKMEQVNADLYVDPSGDDNNSGLSAGDPMRTITHALINIRTDNLNPHSIHLAEGVYAPSTNGESYPLYGRSQLSFSGAGADSTILDAEGTSSIFRCNRDSSFTIENLSIVNGGSSGIYCYVSSPILSNLKIYNNSANSGGGIYCWGESHVQVSNSIITGNTVIGNGGGIACHGDMLWGSTTIDLSGTTITGNSARSGGGIYLTGNLVSVNFDNLNRSNVFLNEADQFGNDLYSIYDALQTEVVVDTFTVMYPTDEYAYPLDIFTFDILNSKIEQSEADLYVSPNGSDDNTGLSNSEPLQTITHALDLIFADELRPHTIYLAEGVYSPSTNGESFPVNCKSYVSIEGVDEETTILDGEGLTRVLHCENVNDLNIESLTIKNGLADNGGGIFCSYSNPNIFNVRIIDNIASNSGGGMYFESAPSLLSNIEINGNAATLYGGGIYCSDSSNLVLNNIIINNNKANSRGGGLYTAGSNPILVNTIIYGDSSRHGGGIYFLNSNPELRRVTINGNTASNRGGGLYSYESNPIFTNVTITGNTAMSRGGGLYCNPNSSLRLVNSILWNDTPQEIYPPSSDANVFYSNVQGSWDGEGNIDSEPFFVDPENGDFNLQVGSPCIDAGTDFFVWESDTVINLSPDEYGGNAPDMGAYESPYTVAIKDEQMLPSKFTLYQNHPNPFNPVTIIQYELPHRSEIQITIYDLLGRTVTALVSEIQDAGYRSIQWDATNDKGQLVSAGVYFYQIKVHAPDAIGAGNYTQTCKMVVLK